MILGSLGKMCRFEQIFKMFGRAISKVRLKYVQALKQIQSAIYCKLSFCVVCSYMSSPDFSETAKDCHSLFNHFIDMGPTLMFLKEKNMFYRQKKKTH